ATGDDARGIAKGRVVRTRHQSIAERPRRMRTVLQWQGQGVEREAKRPRMVRGYGTASRVFCSLQKIPCDKEDNQWPILSLTSPTTTLTLRCSSRPSLCSLTSGLRGAARAGL